MQDLTLTVSKRSTLGKGLDGLRAGGLVPGVIYGQGSESTPVQADEKLLTQIYHQAGGSKLVSIAIEGGDTKTVLFHEVQSHPVTNRLVHFDLYTVKMDEKVRTEVPIQLVGESPAVYEKDGVLLKTMEAMEIEALPGDLPESLELDISGLNEYGLTLHVKDLKVPAGVEIMHEDPEAVIVKIEAPQETTAEDIAAEQAADAEMAEAAGGVPSDQGAEVAEGEEAEGEKPEATGEGDAAAAEDKDKAA